jgi:hypothetical protein
VIDANSRNVDRTTESAVRRWIEGQENTRRGMVRCDVRVAQGRATLDGRTRSGSVARAIVQGTGRIRGVTEVIDRLVADDLLEVGVASAIGRGDLNRQSRLVVRSDFGKVRIGGVFVSNEARAEAMRVGAAYPGVTEAGELLGTDLLS